MNKIRFWVQNARSKSLPQSLLPAVLALCMASQKEDFSFWLGILAVLGVICCHLSLNLFDDYFDYKVKGSEFRDNLAKKGFRARIAKCSYITSGKSDLKQLLIACLTFGGIALCLGLAIFFYRGNTILWFVLISAILGISYSGWPLRLSYHGLGEMLIGIMFGPLLMAGVYYSACGHLDWQVLFISIPVGLLVANIVYVHSIMDYEPDKEVGKMTFAVLLKSKKRMLATLLLLLITAFSSIIVGVINDYLSPFYLLTFLTFPMAVSLFYLMLEFVRHPEKKFSPQLWIGPMGDWKRLQAMDLDWFMIRWLLARNLLTFFCVVLIVVGLSVG
ncbi:1,4-dihydroxy-2-naphthoate octaprenyltransferase [Bacteroidia bacterium]|nr:1,4-dihydroxy-2-naphthoate octaprenyltransferase [Bacteroidia bacterium]GHV71580.1 1,4-dihydroxy-2-naphthoate octaprenyltransferase [Bacteroidia bacterium]